MTVVIDNVDIPNIANTVENQICNAFKKSHGSPLVDDVIEFTCSRGTIRILSIRSLAWVGPMTLRIEGIVGIDGRGVYFNVPASIELDLRRQQRNGELSVLDR